MSQETTFTRVNDTHSLIIDLETDYTHLRKFGTKENILTFNSDCSCYDQNGEALGRIKLDRDSIWRWEPKAGKEDQFNLELIKTRVGIDRANGLEIVEREICLAWLDKHPS